MLPKAEISQKDFQLIALHELTHYKRKDMLYKWLAQAVACLYWLNPLVYLMVREIANGCELACDDAVLAKIGRDGAKDYGRALQAAMEAARKRKESFRLIPFSEI